MVREEVRKGWPLGCILGGVSSPAFAVNSGASTVARTKGKVPNPRHPCGKPHDVSHTALD